jgi:hypothetical protein
MKRDSHFNQRLIRLPSVEGGFPARAPVAGQEVVNSGPPAGAHAPAAFFSSSRKPGRMGAGRDPSLYLPSGEFAPAPWPLNAREKAVVAYRRLVLREHAHLQRRFGLSGSSAAREIGVSPVSIWRWRTRRIVPLQRYCGTISILRRLNVSESVIAIVRRIRRTGKMTAAGAWRAFGRMPCCPPELARYIQSAKNLAPSFIRRVNMPAEETWSAPSNVKPRTQRRKDIQ